MKRLRIVDYRAPSPSRGTPPNRHGWDRDTAQALHPYVAPPWLQELRDREAARMTRIARWRAGRFEDRAEDKRAGWPRPGTPENAARLARIEQRIGFRAPGATGPLSEAERQAVENTRQRIARQDRQAARGIAHATGPSATTSPTPQVSGR